eukprot:10943954-Alexandrium_andersonii.AAC.1
MATTGRIEGITGKWEQASERPTTVGTPKCRWNSSREGSSPGECHHTASNATPRTPIGCLD